MAEVITEPLDIPARIVFLVHTIDKTGGIVVEFLKKSKIDIVKVGKKLKVDYALTWTCYKGEEKPCGKCGSCVERAEAFSKNNLIDPTL